MKVNINPNTAKSLSETIKKLVEHSLDKDESSTVSGKTVEGITYQVSADFSQHTKLTTVTVMVGSETFSQRNIPAKANKNPKVNRKLALSLVVNEINNAVRDGLYELISDNHDFHDKIIDIIEGNTHDVKTSTPFGIDVYCQNTGEGRVFQLTNNGKQMYAFEEAYDLEAGGSISMMRSDSDLIHFTHAVLKKAFMEGEFETIELELEEEEV